MKIEMEPNSPVHWELCESIYLQPRYIGCTHHQKSQLEYSNSLFPWYLVRRVTNCISKESLKNRFLGKIYDSDSKRVRILSNAIPRLPLIKMPHDVSEIGSENPS